MSKRNIKIFADGADIAGMLSLYEAGQVDGFTTNPTLMRNAGVADYEAFAKEILATIRDLPISFEVFSDDFADMRRQALKIAAWGDNVYVKIPVTNTRAESCADLIRDLSASGVKLNVTALLTTEQVCDVQRVLSGRVPAVVSVFAGRIADTGVDPVPVMRRAKQMLAPNPSIELLWASCREALNVKHAEDAGCDIITVTHDILKKMKLFGKCLTELSLDTVRMFYDDARAAGFRL
ncbi:MAG: transaldolase [Bryobacteraceae bacterium]|jgi:transaldolase